MILSVNSSTLQYSITFMTEQGVVIAEHMVTPKGNTFRGFMPVLDFLLRCSGLESGDISGVIVATGPGSFTGLRVGLSSVKGIAYGLKVPVIGVSSIEALAYQLRCTEFRICAMISSRRNEVFYAFFNRGSDSNLVRQSEDKNLKIKDIAEIINVPTIVIGNDYAKQGALIMKAGNENIIAAPREQWSLRASSVGALGLIRFHNNDFDDIMDLVPEYLRPPDIRPSR